VLKFYLKFSKKGLNHFCIKWALKINSNKKTGKRKKKAKKKCKDRTGPTDQAHPAGGLLLPRAPTSYVRITQTLLSIFSSISP
jgi:hypothetical protein